MVMSDFVLEKRRKKICFGSSSSSSWKSVGEHFSSATERTIICQSKAMNCIILSIATAILLTIVLLTIPALTAAGFSNEIQQREENENVKERKKERRLLKGRVDDSRHHHDHHHHGDGNDSSSHAHHDFINLPTKHRHHPEYAQGDKHLKQGLIMTVVRGDGCGPIGRRQHCPPIEVCPIQGIIESPSRRVLHSGMISADTTLQYHEVGSHNDVREDGTSGTGSIVGTDVLDTESLVVNDDIDEMEVGWDGVVTVTGMVGVVPTRRPTAKPTGNAPIKRLTSLPSFIPSPIPSLIPSPIPTMRPTRKPITRRPSRTPSRSPTYQPTSRPSSYPTSQPTPEPTPLPTKSPTIRPTKAPFTQRPVLPSTQRPVLPPPTSTPVSSSPIPPTTINTGNNLINHGGKVMISTQTVAIFWGPKWGLSSYVDDKITGIDAFYEGYGNSNYAAIATEYVGSNGLATAHSTYLGHYIDISSTSGIATPPTHSDIFNEVCKIITANPNTLKPDGSTYYFAVYTDIKRGQAGYCAWHSSGACTGGSKGILIQFAFFFDLEGDAPCDPGDKITGNSQGLAAIVNVSAHELLEVITDPPSFTSGCWYDNSGEEIADKCGWLWSLPYITLSNGRRYKIQMEWSNAIGGCVQGGP